MKTSVSSFDLRVLVAEWQSLIGGYVDKVYQREDEVIFEIFSKGNLVVVREGTIVAVLFPQKFKDRAVEIGEPYALPAAGIDPLELDRSGFATAVGGAKGQVVRVLATILNLGGTYAEEVCLRAGVDKETRIKDLLDLQIDALYTALNNLAVA